MAKNFEPVFTITKVHGNCWIKAAGAKKYMAAKKGVFAYGTSIKTGRGASIIIEFSTGNICRVLEKTILDVTEDVKDKKLKKVILAEGEVEVSLEEFKDDADTIEFHKNNKLNVETPTAICGALGTEFRVKCFTEAGMRANIIECSRGQVKTWARRWGVDLFLISGMDKGDEVVIYEEFDKTFLMLRARAGKLPFLLQNSGDEPKEIQLAKGYTASVWHSKTTDGRVTVTTVVKDSSGKIIETVTFNRTMPPPDKPDSHDESDETVWVFPVLDKVTNVTPTSIPRVTPTGNI